MKFHMRSVAYAATTLGATMMNSVFMFYYVKVYLSKFHVSEGWFQFSQVLFMVWNAINDPLFGYLQDNYDFSWVKSRRHSILFGAPLFALSFVLPWFPWGNYETYTWLSGFQLLISLCFYDTMFTFVLLAQCSLFAEMSSAHEDRIRLVRYSQIASMVGSNSVFFTGLVSANLEFYGAFQMCCLVIGLFAFLCLTYSGRNAHSQYDKSRHDSGLTAAEEKASLSNANEKLPPQQYTMMQQIYQVFTSRDFVSFVLMNFCQVYHVNFLSNFAIVFCDTLISSEYLPSTQRSIYYGSLAITSQVLVIIFAPSVTRIGYYKLVKFSFIFKMTMGVWAFMFGQFWWGVALFFFLESVETHATFSLFNLPLSDVIDVDKEKYQRRSPLSSMVFGTNALITKPAQSIAPMLTVAVLNRFGYGALSLDSTSTPPAELQWVMVMVCGCTSLILGAIQAVIWSLYTIRNSHNYIAKYVES